MLNALTSNTGQKVLIGIGSAVATYFGIKVYDSKLKGKKIRFKRKATEDNSTQSSD